MTDTTLGDRFRSFRRTEMLHRLGILLLIAVVLPFVVFAVPQVVGADQSYVVLSGSMEPTMEPGDVVLVDDVPASQVETGDVITFGGGAATPPTTHRVVDIQESNGERVFFTKGDGNENVDAAPTAASDVRGKVLELPFTPPFTGHSLVVIPLIGYVIQFAGTTTGFVVLVGIPMFLLGGSELLTFVRAVRDGESESAEPDGNGSSLGEDESGATADVTADEAADGGDGVVITRNGIVIAVAGLAALAAASGYRAYLSRTPLAASIAVGSTMACLLVLALLLLDGEDESTQSGQRSTQSSDLTELPQIDGDRATSTTVPDHTVVGSLPSTLRNWPEVRLQSVSDLFEAAARNGTCVIWDLESDQYYFFQNGIAYSAPSPSSGQPDRSTAGDAPVPATGTDRRTPTVSMDGLDLSAAGTGGVSVWNADGPPAGMDLHSEEEER